MVMTGVVLTTIVVPDDLDDVDDGDTNTRTFCSNDTADLGQHGLTSSMAESRSHNTGIKDIMLDILVLPFLPQGYSISTTDVHDNLPICYRHSYRRMTTLTQSGLSASCMTRNIDP